VCRIDKVSELFGRFVTDNFKLLLLLNSDCFFVIEDGKLSMVSTAFLA